MDVNGKEIGLALGGGGSLGAYEMGVWDALRDLKISPTVITGTSIGALIGAFMAADKYEAADKLWKNVTPEKIMRDGINLEWNALTKTFFQDRKKILTFTKNYIKNKGADITPFIELIKSSISAKEIKSSKPSFGVVAVELPLLKQCNVRLSEVPDEQVHDWLFASSAIWPLFPVRTIEGKTYIDGGYKDSLPIQFAFDLGAKEVIAVNLFYKIAWHPLLNRRRDVINIEPSWSLGAAFNFNQKIIDRNRRFGYNDTMKKLSDLIGYRYTFKPYDGLLDLEKKLLDKIDQDFKFHKISVVSLLKKHTAGEIKAGHLFIRGLEVVAETLRLDPTRIYGVSEMAKLIDKKLKAEFDSKEVVAILKKVRSRSSLTSGEQHKAMNAIKYVLEHQFHKNDIFSWLSARGKYVLTYVMLLLIHETFVSRRFSKLS